MPATWSSITAAGQVPLAGRVGEDLTGVQADQFRSTQRPPQPLRRMARLLPVTRRQGVHQQVLVALVSGRGGFRGPDGVQDGQVVGIGQGLLEGPGR
jgi:hypothetical protein